MLNYQRVYTIMYGYMVNIYIVAFGNLMHPATGFVLSTYPNNLATYPNKLNQSRSYQQGIASRFIQQTSIKPNVLRFDTFVFNHIGSLLLNR